MRLVIAVIVLAVAISQATLGHLAELQLQRELADQWQEYRRHIGE